ncbi:hypothetical protein RUM43_004695 [Polyplax serrata]|uniref:Ig-like domain-containing protein n=1 Tax=Polyplax serrata TaxID=468196 RepID=A0AAN8SCS5_POLSC
MGVLLVGATNGLWCCMLDVYDKGMIPVSTGNGIMSHFVNLHIVVPEAFILGSGEHHVDTGSTISLICMIEKSPVPPQYVFWFHNDRMINYDTARGGITVETNPGPKTQSHLIIRDAVDTDSGNYTCSASNTEPASIFVFVSEGEVLVFITVRLGIPRALSGDATPREKNCIG